MKNHEQALLVVLSYVIGFTTAFIMFALVDGSKEKEYKRNHMVRDEAHDVMDTDHASIEVMETDEGLFVKNGGPERIISARVDSGPTEPGFHTAIAASSASPDGMYVHYCAETDLDSGECQHFIYSVAEDKTYMVKDGETALVTPSVEVAKISWSGTSELNLNGRSASQATVWTLE